MDGLIGAMVTLYPIVLLFVTICMIGDFKPKIIFVVSKFIWLMVALLCFGCWLLSKGI